MMAALSTALRASEAAFSSPDSFLSSSEDTRHLFLSQTKTLYDFAKAMDYGFASNSLRELLVSGFDSETVWQQVQLENDPAVAECKRGLKKLLAYAQGDAVNGALAEDLDRVDVEEEEKLDDEIDADEENEMGGDAEDEKEVEGEEDDDDEEDEEEEDVDSDEDAPKQKSRTSGVVSGRTYRQTIVDDQFFKLGQMEEFLDREDRKWQKTTDGDVLDNDQDDDNEEEEEEEWKDEDVDYFKSINDDQDEEFSAADAKYSDFFDPVIENNKKDGERNGSKKQDDEEEDGVEGEEAEKEEDEDDEKEEEKEEEEEELDEEEVKDEDVMADQSDDKNGEERKSAEKLSTFEKNQEKMLSTIKRLEEANLQTKPWQLMGESTAAKRPINSLLEEHVTFEHTTAGAPDVTEETTEKLEDLILQRIKDQAWDDVERKAKPSTQPFEYKRAPELNQERSKLSLAEVYEKEYLEKTKDEDEEKESEEQKTIRIAMQKLFTKLDALSNFHFTPKPPRPDLKVITSNTRSLEMEEVTPSATSDAAQLAPEELHEKKRDLTEANERTSEERKRLRRKKKIKKKFAAKEREKKLQAKADAGDTRALKITSQKKAVAALQKSTRNTIVGSSSAGASVATPKSSSDFFNRLQNDVRAEIGKEKAKGTDEGSAKKRRKTEALKL